MLDFEIFRFSVRRPPIFGNSVDPIEAAPSSVEADILRLLADGAAPDKIPSLLNNGLNTITDDVKKTSLYKLASQVLEGNKKLSWEIVSQKVKETLKERIEDLPVINMEDSSLGAILKEAIKHPIYRQEAVRLHDAWLLYKLSRTKSNNSNTAEEPKTITPILEAALKIGAVFRYIARAADIPPTGYLDKLLNRRLRIKSAIVEAAQTAAFRAQYSRHKEPLPHLSTLRKELGVLTELKRVAVRVLDHLSTEQEQAIPKQSTATRSPGLFMRATLYFFGRQLKDQVGDKPHAVSGSAFSKTLQAFGEASPVLKDKAKLVKFYADKAVLEGVVSAFEELDKDASYNIAKISSADPTATQELITAQARSIEEALPVRVLGFMDLIRVAERLIDNDAREIAHIENRAAGETRERIHTLFESNENLQTIEAEEESEETRDLQTSKRFELQNEAQRTMESELTMEGSVDFSMSYGFIGGSASLDTSFTTGYRNVTAESRRTATNIARQVVDHSLSSLRSRNRRVETARVLRTTEERNRHAFETPGDSKSDVYLWVEKVHEVSLKNYGKRLLLEFIIPEPGISLAYQYSQGTGQCPPVEFTETATNINETNYCELSHRYGARNVNPPPQEFLIVGAGWHQSQDEINPLGTSSNVKIPPGYIPSKVLLSVAGQIHRYSLQALIRISFAGRVLFSGLVELPEGGEVIFTLPAGYMYEVDPQGEGLSVSAYSIQGGAAQYNLALICRRSYRAYEAWQIDTHDRIYAAYKTAIAEYEENLRANPMSAVKGGHPATNRETERNELKRVAIAILNGSPIEFDLFPTAAAEEPPPLPDANQIPRLREALDLYENSLEWEQATYKLYSCYWGNRDRRMQKTKFNVPDPKHRAFLEAGAARVIVPVAPGQEQLLLDHLVSTGADTLLPFTDVDDPAELSAEDVYPDVLDELPPLIEDADNETWETTLVEMNEDLARGVGTLSVTPGSAIATVNEGNPTTFDPYLDCGRAIWINAQEFSIESVDATGKEITLERPYIGPFPDSGARYVIGARLLGAPWEVRVPTPLVVLAHYRHLICLKSILTATPETAEASATGTTGEGGARTNSGIVG